MSNTVGLAEYKVLEVEAGANSFYYSVSNILLGAPEKVRDAFEVSGDNNGVSNLRSNIASELLKLNQDDNSDFKKEMQTIFQNACSSQENIKYYPCIQFTDCNAHYFDAGFLGKIASNVRTDKTGASEVEYSVMTRLLERHNIHLMVVHQNNKDNEHALSSNIYLQMRNNCTSLMRTYEKSHIHDHSFALLVSKDNLHYNYVKFKSLGEAEFKTLIPVDSVFLVSVDEFLINLEDVFKNILNTSPEKS
jgi:hypothetical protein